MKEIREHRESRGDREKKTGRRLWPAVLVLSLLGAAAAGLYVVRSLEARKEAADAYEKMQQAVQEAHEETADAEEQQEQPEAAAEAPAEETPEIPVDFAALQEQNPDIYAWIEVPGTVISYPIVQSSEDDAYYLNHTVDHVSGLPGSIYTEKANSRDFTDANTVIYGHNMRDGSMFAGLHQYEDPQFFEENRQLFIYTPEEIIEYEIFAAYTYDDRHLLKSFDFSDAAVYGRYLEEIMGIRDMNAHFREGTAVTKEDRIVTLSTCIKGRDRNRWLVQAVRVDGE